MTVRVAGVVLAAGSGTRLRPFTEGRPKPLVPVLGRTLLDRALDALRAVGAERVLVNTHVRADLVTEALRPWGPWVTARREDRLSGPAGALRFFADDLADADVVLVLSGDALFEDPLDGLLATHTRTGAALTFAVTAVRDAGQFGVLEVDDEGLLVAAHEKPDVPAQETRLVSAGVYAVRPDALEVLPSDGVVDYVADLVPGLVARGDRIATHRLTGRWFDIGSPAALHTATLHALTAREGTQHRAPTATVEPDAVLHGRVSLEDGTRVGRGAWVQDAVLLPGAHLPPGGVLVGGVLAGRTTVPTTEGG